MESKSLSIHREEQIIEIPQISYDSKMEPIHSTRIVRQGTIEPIVVPSVDLAALEHPLEDRKSADVAVNTDSVQVSGFESLVSIIILCWNNLEYTKKCIESIRKNTSLNYQLVIVDNGSTDGTSGYIETVLNEADILIRSIRNMGFSSGNNLGAKVAVGEYLLFLNNDCEVGADWLGQLINASKDAGIVGASLALLGKDVSNKSTYYRGSCENESEPMSYLEGWCLLIRRKDFFSLGGFDVQFDPFLSEDADLSFRCREADLKIRVLSSLPLVHHGSKSIKKHPNVTSINSLNSLKMYEKWVESGRLAKLRQKRILARQKETTEDVLPTTPANIEEKAISKSFNFEVYETVVKASCDIIIPTYKNEELTIACFESIKENTKRETYRIIWVDNNSKDMSGAAKILEGMNHIAIYLPVNKGFVGAVNVGLAVSDAPTVCILNNDTVVSDRWLEKLTATLYSKKEFGIVGPLTGPPGIKERYDSHHNIAYQQRFRVVPRFPEFTNLADFNKEIEKQLPGVTGEVDFVAFLCAVIKREVIDKVGFLDPNYDMGMWDDTDYNMAVKKAGYQIALALDTCILHKGRATFNMVAKQEGLDVPALLKRNRDYLDKKWANK